MFMKQYAKKYHLIAQFRGIVEWILTGIDNFPIIIIIIVIIILIIFIIISHI